MGPQKKKITLKEDRCLIDPIHIHTYDGGECQGTSHQKSNAARISGVNFNIIDNEPTKYNFYPTLFAQNQGDPWRSPFWQEKKKVPTNAPNNGNILLYSSPTEKSNLPTNPPQNRQAVKGVLGVRSCDVKQEKRAVSYEEFQNAKQKAQSGQKSGQRLLVTENRITKGSIDKVTRSDVAYQNKFEHRNKINGSSVPYNLLNNL